MITDTPLRRPYDPDWTEREHAEAGGRDHLGIETLSEARLICMRQWAASLSPICEPWS